MQTDFIFGYLNLLYVCIASHNSFNKVSVQGLLIAVGIVFGDIGTSPLYTLSAVMRGKDISELPVLGTLSCVIWMLTLQTTIKYEAMRLMLWPRQQVVYQIDSGTTLRSIHQLGAHGGLYSDCALLPGVEEYGSRL